MQCIQPWANCLTTPHHHTPPPAPTPSPLVVGGVGGGGRAGRTTTVARAQLPCDNCGSISPATMVPFYYGGVADHEHACAVGILYFSIPLWDYGGVTYTHAMAATPYTIDSVDDLPTTDDANDWMTTIRLAFGHLWCRTTGLRVNAVVRGGPTTACPCCYIADFRLRPAWTPPLP